MNQDLLRPILFTNKEMIYVSIFNSIDLKNCFKNN